VRIAALVEQLVVGRRTRALLADALQRLLRIRASLALPHALQRVRQGQEGERARAASSPPSM
jgi:hypothetical protein